MLSEFFLLLLTPSAVAFLALKSCEPWKENPSDFKGRVVLGWSEMMIHETVVMESQLLLSPGWDHNLIYGCSWAALLGSAAKVTLFLGEKQTSGALQDHLEWSKLENVGSPFAAPSPDEVGWLDFTILRVCSNQSDSMILRCFSPADRP